MLKSLVGLFVVVALLMSCGGGGVDPANSRGNNPPKPIDGSGNGPGPGTNPTSLVDAVDDPSLVPFLSGKWGYYSRGSGKRYSTHRFEFSERAPKFTYTWTYNSYETLYDIQIVENEYQLQIRKDTIYVPDQITGKTKKFGRIEKVSSDEMKLYEISETGTSYKEFPPYELTKINHAESPANDVILSTSLKSILTGKWATGTTIFDFSSQKNYYQFTSMFGGSKSVDKMEFKVSSDGAFRYRKWADDFDPSWKSYFVQPDGDKLLFLDRKGGAVKFKLSRQ